MLVFALASKFKHPRNVTRKRLTKNPHCVFYVLVFGNIASRNAQALIQIIFHQPGAGAASATFVPCRPFAAVSANSAGPAPRPVAGRAERPRSDFRSAQKTFRAFGTKTGSMEMRTRFGGLFRRAVGERQSAEGAFFTV